MCGWFRLAMVFASRSKRARRSGSPRDVGGQDLDGDRAIEAGVAGLVDLAHAAGADRGLDFVRPEAHTGGHGHGW